MEDWKVGLGVATGMHCTAAREEVTRRSDWVEVGPSTLDIAN